MSEHWKTTALRGKIRRYCECCTRRINISSRYLFNWKRCKCGKRNTLLLLYATQPQAPAQPNAKEFQALLKRHLYRTKEQIKNKFEQNLAYDKII